MITPSRKNPVHLTLIGLCTAATLVSGSPLPSQSPSSGQTDRIGLLTRTTSSISDPATATPAKAAADGTRAQALKKPAAAVIGVIGLGANTIVGLGQSATLSITLSAPAPDNGVTTTLSSSDPSIVTVTPTLFIPAGRTSPNVQPQVTGVSFGAVTISASAPNYTATTQAVQATGSLSFAGKLSIIAPATQSVLLNLSGPAPAAGLVVNLISDDTEVATVVPSVTFPAGATGVNIAITGLEGGATAIHASAPIPNLTGATLAVSVVSTGSIIWSQNATVGVGSSVTLPLALSAPAPKGGLTVTLTSDHATYATVTPATVFIPAGTKTPTVQPQANGVREGNAIVVASAPDFASAGVYLTIGPSSPSILSVNPNTGQQGQQKLSVIITGQNTHFVQGATAIDFGAGITVTSLAVSSSTAATAVISIDPAATGGPRDVIVSTNSEVLTVSHGFTLPVNQPPLVTAGPAQTVAFPASALLKGTVTDDGLPVGGLVSSAWSGVGTGTAISQTWFPLYPQGAQPPGRIWHSVAYNATSNRMIVVGGDLYNLPDYPNPFPNDVWVLTNADGLDSDSPTWIQLIAPYSAASPPPIWGGGTAYDPRTNRLMVFAQDGSFWILTNADGTNGIPQWLQPALAGQPPSPRRPTFFNNLSYDSATNRLIILGATTANDVWILTNANGLGAAPAWVKVTPSGTLPVIASDAAIGYDSGSNTLIAYVPTGGDTAVAPITGQEVWVLSNANGIGASQWSKLPVSGAAPPPRTQLVSAYDPISNEFLIFGGCANYDCDPKNSATLNDAWVVTNANGLSGSAAWQAIQPAALPSPRRLSAAIFDIRNNRLTLFGGQPVGNAPAMNDAWILNWAFARGPRVSFANPSSPQTTASFSSPGQYTLSLTATDSVLSSASITTITIRPPNGPPIVKTPVPRRPSPCQTPLFSQVGLPTTVSLRGAWSKPVGLR